MSLSIRFGHSHQVQSTLDDDEIELGGYKMEKLKKNQPITTTKNQATPLQSENQIVVENTHEPLVDASTFEIANKMVKVKKKRDKNGQAYIFTGLLKCGDCGKSMVYNTTSKSNPYAFYACSNSKRNGKQACSYHLNSYQFTKLIKQYTEVTELTAPLLKELIDKIVIYQSETINGKRTQRIDIYYRFIGMI